MIFGPMPLDDALGAVAGHTLRLGEGGVVMKGSVLGERQIAALRAAGHVEVIAARLDEDDVAENEAADRVAAAVAGAGVHVSEATTGRCNLHAAADGLVLVDRESIDRLNLVDEGVTLATLPAHAAVREGAMLATVKIIPYAICRETLHACEEAVAGGALRVAPFRPMSVGLVLTRLPGVHESMLDRAAAAQRVRAERCGGTVAREIRCVHDEAEIATAVGSLLAAGCAPILLIGASAIADRRDVIPAAVERAGGVVEHFGMPVDPGNLLLLGRHGEVVIVGVPGCARSLRHGGFDMVLERLAARLPVAGTDLIAMGVGGLLHESSAGLHQRDPAVAGIAEETRGGERAASRRSSRGSAA
jgi:molybdenum cofactor cytidylyltransferase